MNLVLEVDARYDSRGTKRFLVNILVGADAGMHPHAVQAIDPYGSLLRSVQCVDGPMKRDPEQRIEADRRTCVGIDCQDMAGGLIRTKKTTVMRESQYAFQWCADHIGPMMKADERCILQRKHHVVFDCTPGNGQ